VRAVDAHVRPCGVALTRPAAHRAAAAAEAVLSPTDRHVVSAADPPRQPAARRGGIKMRWTDRRTLDRKRKNDDSDRYVMVWNKYPETV